MSARRTQRHPAPYPPLPVTLGREARLLAGLASYFAIRTFELSAANTENSLRALGKERGLTEPAEFGSLSAPGHDVPRADDAPPMVLDTQHQFRALLSKLQISTVCDVGSMNGADALTFRVAAPQASIYALGPNPHNLRRMNADRVLQEHHIRIQPLAATNYDGVGDFFLVEADYSQPDFRRGLSSLHRRWDPLYPSSSVVQVKTTRLDAFLADKCRPDGLVEMATDHPRAIEQFNVLFARRDLPADMSLVLRSILMRARRVLGAVARRLCPACLRRYQSLRVRKASGVSRFG